MKLSLLDSDDHRSGNTEPVAMVYKVYRGEQRLTEKAVSLRYGKAKTLTDPPPRPCNPCPPSRGRCWRICVSRS
jgi:hypothetical protein